MPKRERVGEMRICRRGRVGVNGAEVLAFMIYEYDENLREGKFTKLV